MNEGSISDRLAAALDSAVADSGEMITKWCAMVESIDANGERGLWTLTSADTYAWDVLGMLTYGMQMESLLDVALEGR